jgi:hypothetical protein
MEEDIMSDTGRQLRGGVSDVSDPFESAVAPSAARDKEIRDRADKLLLQEEAKEYNARLAGDENVFAWVQWEDVKPLVSIPLDEEGVFLTQRIHWISGRAGAGKTMLAYWKLIQLAKRRTHSAIYECEMGEELAMGLLQNLGASPRDLKYIHYAKAKTEGTVVNMARHGRAFCNMAMDQGIMAMAYDALNPLLVAAALDENKAADVRQFVTAACYPMSLAGGLVLVLDHMGQTVLDRARGSSDKAAASHVDLTLRKVSNFARSLSGAIELTCNKDRTGSIVQDSTLRIDVIAGPDGTIRLKPHEWEDLDFGDDEQQEVVPTRGRRGSTQQKIINYGKRIGDCFTIAEVADELGITMESARNALKRGVKLDSNGKVAFQYMGNGFYELSIDVA